MCDQHAGPAKELAVTRMWGRDADVKSAVGAKMKIKQITSLLAFPKNIRFQTLKVLKHRWESTFMIQSNQPKADKNGQYYTKMYIQII